MRSKSSSTECLFTYETKFSESTKNISIINHIYQTSHQRFLNDSGINQLLSIKKKINFFRRLNSKDKMFCEKEIVNFSQGKGKKAEYIVL